MVSPTWAKIKIIVWESKSQGKAVWDTEEVTAEGTGESDSKRGSHQTTDVPQLSNKEVRKELQFFFTHYFRQSLLFVLKKSSNKDLF